MSDYSERAQALMEVNRWREAIKLLNQARTINPESAHPLCQLAVCHLNLGNQKDALEFANQAIKADPEEEWGYRLRSILLTTTGRTQEALEAAQTAAQLAPDNLYVLRMLAQAQAACGQFSEARQTAERLRELAPDDETSHTLIGNIALDQACWREAEGHFRRALKINPNCYQALNNLGLAVLKQGHNEEATEYFFRAAKLNPQVGLLRENFSHSTRQFRLPGIIAVTALWLASRLFLHEYLHSWWREYFWSVILTLATVVIFTISFYGYPSLKSPEFRSLSEEIQQFLRAEWKRERFYYFSRTFGGMCFLILFWWFMLWGITTSDHFRPDSTLRYSLLAMLFIGAGAGTFFARRRYPQVLKRLLKTIAENA